MNRLVLLTIVSLIMLYTSGCVTDYEEIIPNIRFVAQINDINIDPNFVNKGQTFILEYDSYGKRLGLYGVIIFKLYDEEFYAFDIMCPHEKTISSLIEIDEDNTGYCTCPTCGSEYSVNNEYGGVIKGPTKWPLKKYSTEVRNGDLHIWN